MIIVLQLLEVPSGIESTNQEKTNNIRDIQI